MGMIGRMDPVVIAAIVTTPTALIATAGAYAAGRLQARGAHRGPVDAVRRQHQRDAYASYLSALNAYAYATDWLRCLQRARTEMAGAEGGASSSHDYLSRVAAQARQVRAVAAPLLEPLRPALDVVSLEGPEHVADLAEAAYWTAHALGNASVVATTMGLLWEPDPDDDPNQIHAKLKADIAAFTEAARDYLNG